MQSADRVFANPKGIDVGTSAEDKTVDAIKGIHEHLAVGRGRNDKRRAASSDDRLVVALAEGAAKVGVVACYADDGTPSGSRKLSIDTVNVCL